MDAKKQTGAAGGEQGGVDAILMASGFSKRFGQDKLLYPFRGKPLARHALELVAAMPQLGNAFFVCADDAICRLAEDLPVTVLRNAHPERGQRESVRLGVLASGAPFYLFVPCDQPFLDTATITALLAARAPGTITVPVHGGRHGSPVLFSAAFRQELCALLEGEAPRVLRQRHPGAVVEVSMQKPLPFLDIDTPEDLQTLEKLPGPPPCGNNIIGKDSC